MTGSDNRRRGFMYATELIRFMYRHNLASHVWKPKEYNMTVGTILLIVVILLLIGAIPSWPHSRSWGYGPSGAIGTILLILLILVILGVI